MRLIAGIDEVGYGPLLGPLIVSRTVFETPEEDLYLGLKEVVTHTRKGSVGRVVVADSKKLYHREQGVGALEEGLLPFLASAGLPLPCAFEHLLEFLSCPESSWRDVPWYQGEFPVLPVRADPDKIDALSNRLGREMERREIRLAEANIALSNGRQLNDLFRETGNKGTALFTLAGRHLREIWAMGAGQNPRVYLDRQGGRQRYAGALRQLIPKVKVAAGQESPERSCYRMTGSPGAMELEFHVQGERFFPVALASMLGKYVREIFMIKFNQFFIMQQPGLAPTAGYPEDARRFLKDTEELRQSLAIEDRDLIRER